MGSRVILHADLNNCYASIECLHNPKLRGRPVAVGGSVEQRHGIILAKNYEAKAYGVQVGQALWEARQKCPGLVIVPPDYKKYIRFSRMFRKILSDYSDKSEPFGLDESWLDVSGSASLFGSGKTIADEIRERVKSEMGVTASVGVSFNKIFAKLGSDMKKPDATTVITRENYKNLVWPLPAADLLGVGRSTRVKLLGRGIKTVGDLASLRPEILQSWFGKWGQYLYAYANGLDSSEVKPTGYEASVKSVGNSATAPRDLVCERDARIVFLNLAESVTERMRELGLMARTVEISLRANDLAWSSAQAPLPAPSVISAELADAAMVLLRRSYDWRKPLRGIGIRGTKLVPAGYSRQLSMLEDEIRRERRERLEYVIDDIRGKFGYYSINRAVMSIDGKLGKLNARADHNIHPIGYS